MDKLLLYGRDLTAEARQNKLPPVVGRLVELRRLTEVLCRVQKNNVVLTGAAGVGKTALVEALAQRIVAGDVPERLSQCSIFALDLTRLVAGCSLQGQKEERCAQVVDVVSASNGTILVFIDEFHQAVHATGTMSFSEMLKPALARGTFPCIAATTAAEYRAFVEHDAALARRFCDLQLQEPTHSETLAIVRARRAGFEEHYKVALRDAAVEAVVDAGRFLADRRNPDKAISLLEQACARVRVAADSRSETLEQAEHHLTCSRAYLTSLQQDKQAYDESVEVLTSLQSSSSSSISSPLSATYALDSDHHMHLLRATAQVDEAERQYTAMKAVCDTAQAPNELAASLERMFNTAEAARTKEREKLREELASCEQWIQMNRNSLERVVEDQKRCQVSHTSKNSSKNSSSSSSSSSSNHSSIQLDTIDTTAVMRTILNNLAIQNDDDRYFYGFDRKYFDHNYECASRKNKKEIPVVMETTYTVPPVSMGRTPALYENEIQKLITEQQRLVEQLESLERQSVDESVRVKQQIRILTTPVVNQDDVYNVVACLTGISVAKMRPSDRAHLLNLTDRVRAQVVGQDDAVDAVCRAIQRNRAGLSMPHRPIGTFLFTGLSGCGKTQLAKVLHRELFGADDGEAHLLRLDMSEFHHSHHINRLIGAPTGYKESQQGGQLTEFVKRTPNCIILLDELEKCHPRVCNLFLQILDDARLSDGTGSVADFSHAIIIATSNVGSAHLVQFANGSNEMVTTWKDVVAAVQTDMSRQFTPEFLNRWDEQLVFRPLNGDMSQRIIQLLFVEIQKRVERLSFRVQLEDSAMQHLVGLAQEPAYGARALRRYMERHIVSPLSQRVIEEQMSPHTVFSITCDMETNQLRCDCV